MSKATIVKITSLNADGAEVITDAGKSFIVNSFAPMNGVPKITAPMIFIKKFVICIKIMYNMNIKFFNTLYWSKVI